MIKEIIGDRYVKKIYLAGDVETANLCLSPIYNLPWQISLLKIEGNNIVDSKNWYIKWDESDFKMSEDAARITRYDQNFINKVGIPQNKVKEILIPELTEYLINCDYFFGHNILGFDVNMFDALYKKFNIPLMGPKLVSKSADTFCLAKGVKLNSSPKNLSDLVPWQYRMLHARNAGRGFGLGKLAKDLGVDVDPNKQHDASYDLEINWEVFKNLKKNYGI